MLSLHIIGWCTLLSSFVLFEVMYGFKPITPLDLPPLPLHERE